MIKQTPTTIKILLKRFDLCFYGVNQEKVYDYEKLGDFVQDVFNNIEETDPTEYDNAVKDLIESFKAVDVFTKQYFNVPVEKIKDLTQDYYDDEYGNEYEDYQVKYSTKAQQHLSGFLEHVTSDNPKYKPGEWAGIIDLSQILEQVYDNGLETTNIVIDDEQSEEATTLEDKMYIKDLEMALDNVRRSKEEWQNIARSKDKKLAMYNTKIKELDNILSSVSLKDNERKEIQDILKYFI